jgi:hypothetical protein
VSFVLTVLSLLIRVRERVEVSVATAVEGFIGAHFEPVAI